MEVDVIDDADKGVNQQANGCCKKPLLKRGQGIKVHVGTGKVTGVKSIYMVCVQYILYGVRTAVLTESDKHPTSQKPSIR
jgi:hypothetical protein